MLRALLKIAAQQLWLWALLAPALLLTLCGCREAKQRLVQLYYIGNAWIWGIRIARRGALSAVAPLLVASNHTTYLDVIVLGALGPLIFTPKAEIARWPLIGPIAKLCGAIFIERRANKAAAHRDAVRAALEQGARVSIFPEGTTGDGTALLPFKTSLFAAVEAPLPDGAYIAVQPVAIAYTGLDGAPLTDGNRLDVAWTGDALFFPHIWHFLARRSVEVTVTPLAPVTMRGFADRKALAAYCESRIAQALGLASEPKKAPKTEVLRA